MTTPAIDTSHDRIGIDESGKGDYFGPLVIAAVFVNGTTEPELRLMQVRDSKLISDGRVQELAGVVNEGFFMPGKRVPRIRGC